MTIPFNDPGSTSGPDYKSLNGSLLLFTVHEVRTSVTTTYGTGDAVRADVVVLDGPSKGTEFTDTLVFPKVLQGQLRSSVGGQLVLGRLGQGLAKAGQSAPWLLQAATDGDRATATNYLTWKQGQAIAQPAPAADPVQQTMPTAPAAAAQQPW